MQGPPRSYAVPHDGSDRMSERTYWRIVCGLLLIGGAACAVGGYSLGHLNAHNETTGGGQ